MRPRPEAEFLPLGEAARWYGVSEATGYRLLADTKLKRYRREGDRRTWLSVEEHESLLRPRPVGSRLRDRQGFEHRGEMLGYDGPGRISES